MNERELLASVESFVAEEKRVDKSRVDWPRLVRRHKLYAIVLALAVLAVPAAAVVYFFHTQPVMVTGPKMTTTGGLPSPMSVGGTYPFNATATNHFQSPIAARFFFNFTGGQNLTCSWFTFNEVSPVASQLSCSSSPGWANYTTQSFTVPTLSTELMSFDLTPQVVGNFTATWGVGS